MSIQLTDAPDNGDNSKESCKGIQWDTIHDIYSCCLLGKWKHQFGTVRRRESLRLEEQYEKRDSASIKEEKRLDGRGARSHNKDLNRSYSFLYFNSVYWFLRECYNSTFIFRYLTRASVRLMMKITLVCKEKRVLEQIQGFIRRYVALPGQLYTPTTVSTLRLTRTTIYSYESQTFKYMSVCVFSIVRNKCLFNKLSFKLVQTTFRHANARKS